MTNHLKVFTAVLSVLMMAATLLSTAPAADAQTCVPQTQVVNQDDLRDEPNGCRFMVADPGQGEILNGNAGNRSDILRSDRSDMYLANGFTENFLWYSRQEKLTVTEDNDLLWTGCNVASEPSTACTNNVGTSGRNGPYSVFSSFQGALTSNGGSGSVELDVFVSGEMWIARVCGNWHNIPDRPDPIPTIPIEKFDDADRDGVRDAGEDPVDGVIFKVRRTSSLVGQSTGSTPIATIETDVNGAGVFALKNHGPGTYTITESVPAGSFATTPVTKTIIVPFGIDNKVFPTQRFGNAPDTVDVAKTNFEVTLPTEFEARSDTDITVDVTVKNNGPADNVPITDEIIIAGPTDCTITPSRREFSDTLAVGESVSRAFTFTVNCDRPSFHDFVFDDNLKVDDSRLTDTNLSNNKAKINETRPVLAFTDLASSTHLSCPAMTEVDVAIRCSVDVDVTNAGFGPVDVTATVDLSQSLGPDDCSISPSQLEYSVADLEDGETRPVGGEIVVTCGHRSFHGIGASTTVGAVDIHVIDTDPQNNWSTAAADFEVFHDANLTADDIVVVCDEVIGSSTFTCSATITVSNAGPAPDVETVVAASITGAADCVAAPAVGQQATVILAIDTPQDVAFEWDLDCADGSMLHPFRITADVFPSPNEPHAVDVAGPIFDDWTVPFCMETVNPSGNNVPNAPGAGGQGQNQDGFYIFGAKTIDGDADVWIEDDASGVVWGPFMSGVKIKWIEANGTEPTITFMGGNNGRGNGNRKGNGNGADSVDYQIRAQGDALSVHYDEDGNIIKVACLVPPFPQ